MGAPVRPSLALTIRRIREFHGIGFSAIFTSRSAFPSFFRDRVRNLNTVSVKQETTERGGGGGIMGNKVATFTEEQLEDYQDCTFFTRKEILRIHKRFREMADPGVVPRIMSAQEAANLRLPLSCVARLPELKENPFMERIAEVFTKCRDPGYSAEEGICFEEFLEMMSVFSEHATRDLKVFYAFTIYDFDDDGMLGIGDLEKTCKQLANGGLTNEEMSTICRKVLEESDIDGDGALSYLEFEHVITRAPDFLPTFHIRI